MFGNFFKRKKKKQRDLFEELFPLTNENQNSIESTIDAIQKQMFGEEKFKELRNYSREYEIRKTKFGKLTFDTLGWEVTEENENSLFANNKYGDNLSIAVASPNGKMVKGKKEIHVYRNWLREIFVQQGGGLILCEEFESSNGIIGYESIAKSPREGGTGMDYTYFLNLSNYEEQKLYQIIIKVFEQSVTGLRDNLMMTPLSKVANIQIDQVFNLYRKDPYDKSYKEGNKMNLSEREEFDYLFPFHPLSIIRREIKPRLRDSISFE